MNAMIHIRVVVFALSCIAISQILMSQSRSKSAVPVYEYSSASTNNIGISITHSYGIGFGVDLLPGIDRIIYPIDPGGRGGFQIEGEGGQEISVSFILPTHLSNGASNMPVSFSGDYAGYGTNPMGSNLKLFNPVDGTQFTLSALPNYVFIGGRAMPSSSQPAGVYTGLITIQVEYVGN